MRYKLAIFAFFLTGFLNGVIPELSIYSQNEEEYIEKSHPKTSVDDPEVLKKIKSYLLPDDHYSAGILKIIFSKRGVLSSVKALEKAGFEFICHRQGRGLLVVRHPLLKGYLLKIYLDIEKHSEWVRWARRVRGARFMQAVLDKNTKFSKYFKVPKKWIYILPKKKRGKGDFPRESVLLIEDMKLVDKQTTRELYKVLWSYDRLEALYVIIKKCGFSDGHIDNLPFSKDHRIAFIDTEYTNKSSVHFEWLTKWFSASKQRYWEALIEQGGP
ncbi:MAG: hypothetical protein H0T62_02990 [Parachlamydiaceae bacterium]|nr:hypothetical protein [Parachlamydiaceae bacterium]